jgi:hypothetical protein
MAARLALVSLAVGCLLAAASVPACNRPRDRTVEPATSRGTPPAGPGAADQELVNEEWRLLKMATAQGIMVIEVEVADPSRGLEIARTLREPLGGDYAEVLIYIHRMGEGTQLPVTRVRWTPSTGYEEMVY